MTAAAHRTPRPRDSLDRCALRAQLRGDALLGTAFPADRLLLVEQPGPWGHGGLRQSRFDPAVAGELEDRVNAAGVRLLAIRRPGRTPRGAPRRVGWVDCRPHRQQVRWTRFGTDRELLDVPLDGSLGEPADGTLFLVCAHGTHDVCCALRGRPVAAALAAARPGQVWECSHVGGERFAPNVLTLPSGLLYGRVLAFAAEEFAAAVESGEVIGALLRGRVGFPPLAQAALAFGYEQLGVRDLDGLEVRAVSAVQDGSATVRLATPRGDVDVTVVVERVRAAGLTCDRPGPGAFLAYRPVSADPVPEPV